MMVTHALFKNDAVVKLHITLLFIATYIYGVRFVKVKKLAKALSIDPYTVRSLMKTLSMAGVVDEFIVSRDGRGRTKYKIYVVKDEDEFNKAIKALRETKRRFV